MNRELLGAMLDALEVELKRLHLWTEEEPDDEQLMSTEPFAIDTMDLHQWFQWLLIPRLRAALTLDEPLPVKSGMAVVVEEFYRGSDKDIRRLLAIVQRIDALLNEG
jgi:uncharacterized protein YqcC (DUF446 family)